MKTMSRKNQVGKMNDWLLHLKFSSQVWRLMAITSVLMLLPFAEGCGSNGEFSAVFSEFPGKHTTNVATKVFEFRQQKGVNTPGMDFSPDGKYLALSAYGNTTNIYDWTNGRIIKSLESAYGTNGGQSTKPMQFSPDGTLFASCTSQVKNDVVVRI